MRVLGVDPGLTRCGVGVVDGSAGRALTLVEVTVLRTPTDVEVGRRLQSIADALTDVDRAHRSGRRGRGAGVQPAQCPHGHGHRPGCRAGHRGGFPGGHPGRTAHSERGQSGDHRLRSRRQDSGERDGVPAAPPARGAPAGRRDRRAGPRDLPAVARAGAGPDQCGGCRWQASDDRQRARRGLRSRPGRSRRRGRWRRPRGIVLARHVGSAAGRADRATGDEPGRPGGLADPVRIRR